MSGRSTTNPGDGWLPRSILAATDFSVESGHALERAAALARRFAARLTIVHVVPASLWEDIGGPVAGATGLGAPSAESVQALADERLQRRAAELAQRDGIRCDALTLSGRPVARLAQAAADRAVDLLVLGAHGEHPVASLVLGTTAQKLLRLSPCPVLLVKREPSFDYDRVLLPTDFSPASRAATQATAALLPQARLHLAHAFELPYDGLMRFANVDAAARDHYHREARERLLAQLADWANDAAIERRRRALHVENGYPPRRIDRWIEELAIQLVALAAHGRSELEATFLGSVSLHAIQSASCDMLLLRGARFT